MKDWNRKYFTNKEGHPFLFYVLFGDFEEMRPLSRSVYHSNGVHEGIELMHYSRESHEGVLEGFCEGYLWDRLNEESPTLAPSINKANECFILKGEIEDPETLNYFRDSIGLLTYLADHGGVALYDPQMFKWWSIENWKNEVFEPHDSRPRQHVEILVSEEEEGYWYHTRGMRKFGRPDLSIRNIVTDRDEPTIEVINRFIEFQALGGIIEEGQEIRVNGFPEGYTCHHQGDLEDPDFNNVHVEISTRQHEVEL